MPRRQRNSEGLEPARQELPCGAVGDMSSDWTTGRSGSLCGHPAGARLSHRVRSRRRGSCHVVSFLAV
jgi:hypothetical protein